MVTAYLGFDNIVDLQRFVIMWPCLEAIRLICALPGETSNNLVFPSLVETSQALESRPRARPTNEYIQHCWVACVLITLQYNVAVYQTNTYEQNRARTIVAIQDLPPRFWVPDHIMEEKDFPPYPILQPNLRFSEPSIIPLHRCLCLSFLSTAAFVFYNISNFRMARRIEGIYTRMPVCTARERTLTSLRMISHGRCETLYKRSNRRLFLFVRHSWPQQASDDPFALLHLSLIT